MEVVKIRLKIQGILYLDCGAERRAMTTACATQSISYVLVLCLVTRKHVWSIMSYVLYLWQSSEDL